MYHDLDIDTMCTMHHIAGCAFIRGTYTLAVTHKII